MGELRSTEESSPTRYAVTYTFNGDRGTTHRRAISLICETAAGLQGEGIDIEFLGAIQEIDAEGQLTEVRARYSAPNKGVVGQLNFRAGLPAGGSPVPTDQHTPEWDRPGIVAASSTE